MVRPRWHDAVIVSAIVGIFAVGIWALWWDDVRGLWDDAAGEDKPALDKPAPMKAQT
jgi:hypothetical protein